MTPEQTKELLPFLIPLIVAQFALLGYTLYHILTHKTYKRWDRKIWLIITIVGMEFIGPILYFLLGKEDA
ncbi:MAG: PLDc N-terminal domain-containing protein [Clostridia bacterium]|nr:PLDc N-terminal domain-containing protein [Clostridia bacterium]